MFGDDQRTVSVKHRVRPIRFAFLVRPSDRETLLKTFQINTSLWGGQYNAIIPFYHKTPRSWNVRQQRTLPARNIIEGYIEAFDPDFLVIPKGLNLRRLPFPEDRIIYFPEVFNPENKSPIGYGTDIRKAFIDLYEKELKYIRRHPIEVFYPLSAKKDSKLFIAACFGDFPDATGEKNLKEIYIDFFKGSELLVDASNYLQLQQTTFEFPLRTGNTGLDISSQWRSAPTIFYMDHNSSLDLIDLWNLRAMGWLIMPIPRSWSRDLALECSKWIKENYSSYSSHFNYRGGVFLLCSRSCESSELGSFAENLDVPLDHIVFRDHYPELWNLRAYADYNEGTRCTVSAKDVKFEAKIHEDIITRLDPEKEKKERFIIFEEPSLDNEGYYRSKPEPSTMNVLEIENIYGSLEFSPVIPDKAIRTQLIFGTSHKSGMRYSSEGLVFPNIRRSEEHILVLPKPKDILSAYFVSKGLNIELSDKGRIVTEIVNATDGLRGLNTFKKIDLIELLNSLAGPGVDVDSEGLTRKPKNVKARPRVLSKEELINQLVPIYGDGDLAGQAFDDLMNIGVWRLGIRLQCPRCMQRTWLDIPALSDSNLCERCLNEFPFPTRTPEKGEWTYRTIGPFSIDGYAQGSYAVALAMQFFAYYFLWGSATIIPSFKIKNMKRAGTEIDFCVFWRTFGKDIKGPLTIFGECKTFNKFKQDDVVKIQRVGRLFPGATLAFCTLSEKLKKNEKDLIKPLATDYRERRKRNLQCNPILVLTQTELMSAKNIQDCWKEAGKKQNSLRDLWNSNEDFHNACCATHEIYLDMEPYA